MAEARGRPKTLVRRHVLEIKKDTREWIEETIGTFTDKRAYGRTSRVRGAGIAAAGIYTMVRLVGQFGRGVFEEVRTAVQDISIAAIPTITIFTSIFGIRLGVKEDALARERVQEKEFSLDALQELGQFDPFAFGAALTAGGMVLAGLNPGEILKGIGSIIDALIPL